MQRCPLSEEEGRQPCVTLTHGRFFGFPDSIVTFKILECIQSLQRAQELRLQRSGSVELRLTEPLEQSFLSSSPKAQRFYIPSDISPSEAELP